VEHMPQHEASDAVRSEGGNISSGVSRRRRTAKNFPFYSCELTGRQHDHCKTGNERGSTRSNWLDSRHTFSFGDYYDPKHMGFGHLKVINEDRVIPGAGFPTHSHRDMEIITYVLEGSLAPSHKNAQPC
jgi:Pirin